MGGQNKVIFVIKWLVMLSAYGFLIYKLANNEYWSELADVFTTLDLKHFLLIVIILLLMPVNWMVESRKWQLLTANTTSLRFGNALKAVLAGLGTGYITPNRIGEFAGRIAFLPQGHRLAGVALSIVNSLTQNLVITVFGLAGVAVYFSRFYNEGGFSVYFTGIGVGFLVCIVLYFVFPSLFRTMFKGKRFPEMVRNTFKTIGAFKVQQLITILGVSVARYMVFCTQYYMMLLFFDINLTPVEALAAIPAIYLFITFTPSFAASEPAIRSSAAMLVLCAFSTNEIAIMLTGILIWLINFAVPMLAGTVIIGKTKNTWAMDA